MRSHSSEGVSVMVVALMALIFAGIIGTCSAKIAKGAGIFGPTRQLQGVEVVRTYVDYSGSGNTQESHYMVVTTSNGVYEVANGWFLGVWTADEIFGQFVTGGRYDITTRGNRVVSWYAQAYPYITKACPSVPRTEVERP